MLASKERFHEKQDEPISDHDVQHENDEESSPGPISSQMGLGHPPDSGGYQRRRVYSSKKSSVLLHTPHFVVGFIRQAVRGELHSPLFPLHPKMHLVYVCVEYCMRH